LQGSNTFIGFGQSGPIKIELASDRLKLQGNDQLITSLRAPRRCLSLSTQPQANKPAARRLTSSRRFDYLIVKEQHTKNALQRSDLAIWLKTLSPNQRKERNDNAKSDLVKRVLAGSKEAANTRITSARQAQSAGNLSVGTNSLHERRTTGRVSCMLSRKSDQRQNCHFAVKGTAESEGFEIILTAYNPTCFTLYD